MNTASDRRAGAPLDGKCIVLTRPTAQAYDFADRIRALGGIPVVAPAVEIAPADSWAPMDDALARLPGFEWIAFTSANAVTGLVARADAIGVSRSELGRRRFAAVGPATASTIAAALRQPDLVAARHNAASLAAAIPVVPGMRVLFPRSNLAGDALPDGLRARGADVTCVEAYRTIHGAGLGEIVSRVVTGKADALLFASASAVRAVASALVAGARGRQHWPAIVCIGDATAAAARACEWPVVAVADDASVEHMLDCLVELFSAEAETRP